MKRGPPRTLPRERYAVGLLLAAFVGLAVASLPYLSLTTDEPRHYRYGRKILDSDAGRFEHSQMPITALNAFPAWLGERLPDSPVARGLRHFQVARLPTIAFAAGLGLVIYFWSRRLHGSIAALTSLFLYALDPNILGHARLITTDVYVAAAMGFALFFTWRFARKRSVGRALAAAAAAGIAQATKYTALAVLPLLAAMVLVYDLPRLRAGLRRARWRLLAGYAVKSMILVVLFVGFSLLAIHFAFLGEYTLLPLQDYQFQSAMLSRLQTAAAGIDWIRVPLPLPYLDGLDSVMHWESSGIGYARFYLLGELRERQGFPGYFLVAYALKTPIPTLILFLLGLGGLLREGKWRTLIRGELFAFVPWAFFTGYFNLFSRAQIGIRFVLLTLPLTHILAGRVARGFRGWPANRRGVFLAGLAAVVVSTLSYHPDYLAYFNEVVWDRRQAYRYLADSNLDWGQSEVFLEEYLATHPTAMLEPDEVTEGEIIVRVNNLVGITESPDKYARLREECSPERTVGHAYLVYRVPCDEAE